MVKNAVEDCGGKKRVRTIDIASSLKESRILASKRHEFLDQLVSNSSQLLEFDQTRQLLFLDIYLLYAKALEVWVQQNQNTSRIADLIVILKSLDLNTEAEAILVLYGNQHVCGNCKVVVPHATPLHLKRRPRKCVIQRGLLVWFILAVITLAILLLVLVSPILLHNIKNKQEPTTDFTFLPSTTVTQEAITQNTHDDIECTFQHFIFGPRDPFLPDMASEELLIEVETYSDLKPEATCGDRRYAISVFNWTCMPLKTLEVYCPGTVTSLSIAGDILHPQFAQSLEGLYNLRSVTLINPQAFCKTLESTLDILPLKLEHTEIKSLTLKDMPRDCKKGLGYLSDLIRAAGNEYYITIQETGKIEYVHKYFVKNIN